MSYRPLISILPPALIRNSLFVIAALAVASSVWTTRATQAGDLRFELPANGNLRVENLRGGVIVQVWSQNYVSVSATGDDGQLSPTPPIVDRGETLLSVRLAR